MIGVLSASATAWSTTLIHGQHLPIRECGAGESGDVEWKDGKLVLPSLARSRNM
jgi:hypothetical protein